MVDSDTSAPVRFHSPPPVPDPPKPAHMAVMFHRTQRRFAQRPINHFPWRDFHLRMSSQGYVVGSDWAMTSFDDRTEDQFLDSKRLQTIDEGTEIRYFYPYDPLNYSSGVDNLNVVDEVRRLDLHQRESITERVFRRVKDYLTHICYQIRDFCRHLSACV
ncbi:hypothetical protein ACEPAG_380 [Sanghuangporus baumii]